MSDVPPSPPSTPPPRRKRFQFHLSTAIVLMMAAGGVVWANIRVVAIELSEAHYMHTKDPHRWLDGMGWPYPFLYQLEPMAIQNFNPHPATPSEIIFHRPRMVDFTLLIDDLFIAILILALTFGAWEGVLRVRRHFTTPRKPTE